MKYHLKQDLNIKEERKMKKMVTGQENNMNEHPEDTEEVKAGHTAEV